MILVCLHTLNLHIKSLKRVEMVQNRKLENVKVAYLSSGTDPDKVNFNYSAYKLNDVEEKVLSRGLKFSVRPEKLKYCEFLMPFEKLATSLKTVPLETKSSISTLSGQSSKVLAFPLFMVMILCISP